MKKLFLAMLLIGAYAASVSAGPIAVPSAKDIGDDIVKAIRDAPRQKVIEVLGTKQLTDPVTKTDLLIFNPGGVLELAKTNGKFVIVVAKEVVVQKAVVTSYIRRSTVLPTKANDGPPGANGTSYDVALGSQQGRAGGPGGPGSAGDPGSTLFLPDVYLLFGDMHEATTNGPVYNFTMQFDGIPGGTGGSGGPGGVGGNGEKGQHASCHGGIIVFCDSGPGSGGNGGAGGAGARGGDGASGGDGATLYVGGPQAVLGYAQRFTISNRGAQAGGAGTGGSGGPGGLGGFKGFTCGTCNDRDDGRHGPSGPTGPVGTPSPTPGRDGLIYFVLTDVGQFFP